MRATSTADPTRSGTAAVNVAAPVVAYGQPNGVVVNHGSDIAASETRAGDGITHNVTFDIGIRANTTVTVAPCALMALAPGVSITLLDSHSRLVAAGTSATRFVTFRRANAAQGWGQLYGSNSATFIDLAYTRLEGGDTVGPAINIVNSVITVSAGGTYGLLPTPLLRVDNVTVQGSADIGIYLQDQAAFTADSRALTVTGSAGRPAGEHDDDAAGQPAHRQLPMWCCASQEPAAPPTTQAPA